MLAPLELEQRQMPGDVEGEVVAAAPGRTRSFEPGDAFARAALHLMHVADRMQPPGVLGLDLDRAPPDSLGSLEMPELLEREGVTAEKKAVARARAETTGRGCARSTRACRGRRRA